MTRAGAGKTSSGPSPLRRDPRRGATTVEMAICSFLLIIVLIGVVDVCRMVLVFSAISNAARAGTRYATVHGCDRIGADPDGPSGRGKEDPVKTVVRNFGGAGLFDTSAANSGFTITVDYPDGTTKNCINNIPGNRVTVAVSYVFTPLVGYFVPLLKVTLANTSQGIITY